MNDKNENSHNEWYDKMAWNAIRSSMSMLLFLFKNKLLFHSYY